MTTIEEAKRRFYDSVQITKPRSIGVPLDSALNRVFAQTLRAKEDLPRFDRSAVDGYAVRAEDTVGASQSEPRIMALTAEAKIGRLEAKEVWTGNPIPAGANAVIMLENTKRSNQKVEVWASLTPHENVSARGEDVRKGEIIVSVGTRLKPHHIGLLAAFGIDKVGVFEKPKIAVLATGNELVEIGSKLGGHQSFDSDRHIISALCQELGAETIDLGIAKDDLQEIMSKLHAGLEADAIITTGGTSTGEPDLMPKAVGMLGKPGVIVHGVAMRPAMPTGLAVVNGKPIFMLSGNPVAAMIGFEVFVRPLLCRMTGLNREERRPVVDAKLVKKVGTALGRRTYVRVRVFRRNSECFAEPVSAKGSGLISTMTRSNGYVIVSENREGLREGESVLVHMFDDVEVVD